MRRTSRPIARSSGYLGLLETLEVLQVDNARAKGWSWQEIATRLGVSKQAVHQKHGRRGRPEVGR
jgi:predicted DNA-binding protein YlxM (UPF0122 family)